MPRSKPSALTVPQSPSPGATSPPDRVNPRERYSDYTSPVNPDSGAEPLESPTFSGPQSPASPRQSSRSLWGRTARKVKNQAQDATPGRHPPAFSSGTNLPPHESTIRPVTSSSTSSPERPYAAALPEPSNTFSEASVQNRSVNEMSSISALRSNPRAELDPQTQRRPSKNSFSQFVNRSRSGRTEANRRHSIRPPPPRSHLEPVLAGTQPYRDVPHTAPIDSERGYREMFKARNRDKSNDRRASSSRDGDEGNFKPGSSYETGGLFSGLKNVASKAGETSGKTGKGFFGRFTRSASAHEPTQEVSDEKHVLRVINQPLSYQTRRTRIKDRIEDALDKTEYWLPSLPYRSIEYLNAKASEEEGLYRVSGSTRDIKHWQVRFDTERDVNLLEQQDLYDPNAIGGMLKSWIRELPDELFPKSIQARLAQENQGAITTPQAMRDELSRLPPYNYYLLFAITCHIAILLSKSDKNKMSYQNLCICFQPCVGIDGFCFYFLVCDWTNCWQGCWTEKEYYQREEDLRLNEAPPSSAGQSSFMSNDRDFDFDRQPTISVISASGRPHTGAGESSSAPSSSTRERRRPSGIAAPESYSNLSAAAQGWDHRNMAHRPRPANPVGRSPPPSLSPLPILSPMRLSPPPDDESDD